LNNELILLTILFDLLHGAKEDQIFLGRTFPILEKCFYKKKNPLKPKVKHVKDAKAGSTGWERKLDQRERVKHSKAERMKPKACSLPSSKLPLFSYAFNGTNQRRMKLIFDSKNEASLILRDYEFNFLFYKLASLCATSDNR